MNRPKAMDWTSYHTLQEIYAWLDETAAAHSNVMTVSDFGTSFEGRPMKVVKISYKTGNRAIFIESNIHAREWITSATATWIINELLNSNDVEVRRIAESYDWYIVPVLNVDGFVHTHEVVSFSLERLF
jgi:murein tripeptide amidase MpaA